MYSGTTLTKFSGRILGAHQKIDRIARRNLKDLLADNSKFPSISSILHFEGLNGPDAIKRKSPAKDEPWHYFSPFDDKDTGLFDIINGHFHQLVAELKSGNAERAAFESAWLAHALVDGLTPAHHYPYEAKLMELRAGEGIETRTTIKEKWLMHGTTKLERVRNNWLAWGPKGLLTAHGLFEMGVATIIMPLTFSEVTPKAADIATIKQIGVTEWFKRAAREVAVLDMFENYTQKGWTPKLAWQVRHKLGPALVKTVTLSWYMAAYEADLIIKS